MTVMKMTHMMLDKIQEKKVKLDLENPCLIPSRLSL